MHRQHILTTISLYLDRWDSAYAAGLSGAPVLPPMPWNPDEEKARAERIATFVSSHPDCFERSCLPGHITGSALVVSQQLDAVLLTLHKKLGAWLQLGGHSDGDPWTHRVAMREAEEESGLSGLTFLAYEQALGPVGSHATRPEALPFDFDCHVIPARPTEPAHVHYDVRFLITADRDQPVAISEESHDLRWFSLADAENITREPSMLRQFAKLRWLKQRLYG